MNSAYKRRFWRVGGRTLKTVAAVFIALAADGARPGGIPFYAAITAIFCIQKNVSDSFETAVNREVSTIVGGAFGMLFLFVEQAFEGHVATSLVHEAAAALCLIPIISISVWLGRPKSTFLMCVVFLSVVIMHGDDVHPFFFALNRILDTTIGIVTALIVNVGPGKLWRKHWPTAGSSGNMTGGREMSEDEVPKKKSDD